MRVPVDTALINGQLPSRYDNVQTPAAVGANLCARLLVEGPFMRGIPAPGSLPQKGLVGTLRSWLGISSDESWFSQAELPTEARVPRAHAYGSVRVLVVDDNPVNLMVTSALLESRGIETFLAADGAQAVALASEFQFDLVLMDLQMPVLDGLDATSAIRRNEGECSRRPVPVLAYTSTSPGAHVLAAHGMNGSLNKPCEDQELEDCLARWCAPLGTPTRGNSPGPDPSRCNRSTSQGTTDASGGTRPR